MKPVAIASQLSFDEVEEFDALDMRRSAVDCLFANIIGVNDGWVEWCPNNDPPNQEEYFAWLWFVKPSLGAVIQPECAPELSKLIQHYNAKEMDQWFDHIAT